MLIPECDLTGRLEEQSAITLLPVPVVSSLLSVLRIAILMLAPQHAIKNELARK